MNKWIRSFIIVVLVFFLFAATKPSTTGASTYVNKEFATLAKKGKLKGIYGNVGMTYKTLKKKQKGKVQESESYLFYHTKSAYYGFFRTSTKPIITSSNKAVIICKDIKIKVSSKQFSKYFGKPVAYHTYKAGKYYVRYLNYPKGVVEFHIGTKAGMNAYFTGDIEGKYTIK